MSLVGVYATNYIVMSVGKCDKVEWEYQEQDNNKHNEYHDFYKIKGMPVLSKDENTINAIGELVELSKRGDEIEVIVDEPVDVGQVIIVQEVISFGNKNIGTYRDTTPVRNDDGDITYTGIVMDYDDYGYVQVYVLRGKEGIPQTWHIQEGLAIRERSEIGLNEEVKLGGAIRFMVKEDEVYPVEGQSDRKLVAKIDVINKYV